jgi:hypothetical protein
VFYLSKKQNFGSSNKPVMLQELLQYVQPQETADYFELLAWQTPFWTFTTEGKHARHTKRQSHFSM